MNEQITPPMHTPSLRVLIVDDITQVRQDLNILLLLAGRKAGVPIQIIGEACNGEEAVSQAAALRPEVIVMDLAMPVLDGYEATRKIKNIDPACRVIALTVHDYDAARQKALQCGVDDFVVKGAPLETLIQAISTVPGLPGKSH